MQEGLADLTEKERETLRLLLAGHDTKSTAAELGLSVHTISDRLRSARRKLGVTSSREAARILGDAEGGAPQKPAPTQLGMGEAAREAQSSGHSQPARPGNRRLAWLAGGLAMIAIIAAAILALTPATEAPPQAEAIASSVTDEGARHAALEWLALVDAGEWQQSWEAAGAIFRSEITAPQWTQAASAVRDPLGELVSREVLTIQQTENLPGVPEGEYVVMQFTTAFENAPAAIETVIMRAEDDDLNVVGYFIR